VAKVLLQTEDLTRRFGGVFAANAITLDIVSSEVHAVVGPNGAGKTTLIGLLSGEIIPQRGSIHFDGTDITQLPVYRRSRLGLARSFQITSLFHDFTALENVALAVQAHCGHSFRFWRDARRERELRQQVAQLKRVVADKTLEADFFKGALQKIAARRQASTESGGTASTARCGK